MSKIVECLNISKTYSIKKRLVKVLCDINLAIDTGSFCAIVGQSGCGKTTLLRILSGLESPSSGSIKINFYQFSSEKKMDFFKNIGYVFQEPRLMHWLDVFENVSFGLKKRFCRKEQEKLIYPLLDKLGLSGFSSARIDQLSGGMASRVSIARALVLKPKLLLLDEPFCSLDAMTRKNLQDDLVKVCRKENISVIFVTHDIEEACLLAGDIYHISAGRVFRHYKNGLPYPRNPVLPGFFDLRRDVLGGFEKF